MPSNSGPVTLSLQYRLQGAPCNTASLGNAGAGSGCTEVALDVASAPLVRDGVPVLAGGAGVEPLVTFAPGRIAGDWKLISCQVQRMKDCIYSRQFHP